MVTSWLHTDHMTSEVEYSVEPIRTSHGWYHRVTTSWEYVRVGTDFALAGPKSTSFSFRLIIKLKFVWGLSSVQFASSYHFINRKTWYLFDMIYYNYASPDNLLVFSTEQPETAMSFLVTATHPIAGIHSLTVVLF